MPKESTHLFLSHLADKEFSEKDKFRKMSAIINAHPGLFYLGSVSPDTIFNYTKGSYKDFFKKNIQYSHDSNTHNVFGFLTQAADKKPPILPSLSFAFGTISHLIADAVFHPLIFYFTGNDKTDGIEATIRHYYFEAALDKMLRWLNPWLKHFHLMEMELFSSEEQLAIAGLLEAIHISPEDYETAPAEEFLKMSKQHIKHEKYYGRLEYRVLTALVSFITAGKKEDLKALFFTDKNKHPTEKEYNLIMEKKINFKNPQSGEEYSKSLNNLIDDYLALFSETILPIEEALKKIPESEELQWDYLKSAFDRIIPHSPITGLVSFPVVNARKEMKFFEIKSFKDVL